MKEIITEILDGLAVMHAQHIDQKIHAIMDANGWKWRKEDYVYYSP
jgi:hypothetical protein